MKRCRSKKLAPSTIVSWMKTSQGNLKRNEQERNENKIYEENKKKKKGTVKTITKKTDECMYVINMYILRMKPIGRSAGL